MTTKMIVEMVLMKPTVVRNKRIIVKCPHSVVADGISSALNSAKVVTMAYNDLIYTNYATLFRGIFHLPLVFSRYTLEHLGF